MSLKKEVQIAWAAAIGMIICVCIFMGLGDGALVAAGLAVGWCLGYVDGLMRKGIDE